MKSFKSYIKLQEGSYTGGISSDVPSDFHRLDQEDVKVRVNAWLEGCSNMEFMSVDAALNNLANKIEQIGLHFDTAEMKNVSAAPGNSTLSLRQFGEKLDPAETHALEPVIPEDLSMRLSFETTGKGGFVMSAQLN